MVKIRPIIYGSGCVFSSVKEGSVFLAVTQNSRLFSSISYLESAVVNIMPTFPISLAQVEHSRAETKVIKFGA